MVLLLLVLLAVLLVASGIGLVVAGALQASGAAEGMVFFGVLSFLLIVASFSVILQRSPIRSALSLVVTMFLLAVMFLSLDAQLVAALQIIVYAGAVMVLFLFVIMLLNLQEETQVMARLGTRVAAGLGGVLFLIGVTRFFVMRPGSGAALPGPGMSAAVPAGFGQIEMIGERMFTQSLLAFEVTSLLLLVAIIGAVVLAKRTVV